ncbi:hypothetical protein [Streptomyces sp. NPDC048411]|uniref:hypothetical protein n=1 Tax=Streptomyces sp. NPDC048411 TaxID=3157206 RepID=UPI003452C2B6
MRKLAKSIVMAAAVPVLLAATAIPAQADGSVTWRNNKTDRWLSAARSGSSIVTGSVLWDGPNSNWYDIQNSDGSWNEQGGLGCLTGYGRQVYTEPCDSRRDMTNWWQRWYEISTPTGWKLQNKQTNYILDDAGNGAIYANENDVSTSKNQRWR